MPRQFNILATTERINEGRAGSELWMLLRAAGDEVPRRREDGHLGHNHRQDPLFALMRRFDCMSVSTGTG